MKIDKDFNKLFSDEEKIMYFFAGLAHDINHSNYKLIVGGTNNQYEIALKTKLAEEAQNEAVL